MINSYVKVAGRSLLKRTATNVVNICGLAVAICGALFIGVFVLDELQYDQHFPNKDRIYRLTTSYESNGIIHHSAQTRAGIAPLVRAQQPAIENITRLMATDEVFLSAGQRAFKENIIYTDSSFLSVFALNILAGAKGECLKLPSSIIISESRAAKLFGPNWSRAEVLGTTLLVDNKIPLTITGVFRDLPARTHFNAHLFASLPSGLEQWMSDESRVYSYVMLGENADAAVFERTLATQSLAITRSAQHDEERIHAQLLSDIHLSSSLEDENAILGNRKNLYALSVAALVLLFIAITNFANLYTASSLNRIREVGVRKALGALSLQVRCQFWLETLLITCMAVALALAGAMGLLPLLNELTGKDFSFSSFLSREVLVLLAAVIIGISIAAGLYPALMLSRVRAIHALKGNNVKMASVTGLKKALIVVQFSTSAIAIALSLVAYKQMAFINSKPLGFDKEHTVALANPYMLGSTDAIISFKNELMTVPGIESVSITGYTPSQTRWVNHKLTFPDRDPGSAKASIANWIIVDQDFIATMGLSLVAGRTFLGNHEHDRDAIIVNEEAVSQFRLGEGGKNPVGAELSIRSDVANGYDDYRIIGVVKDFHFGSMHELIQPMIMKAGIHRFEMMLRLSPAYPQQEVLQRAESMWKRNIPAIPFEFSFVKDRFDLSHRSDTNAGSFFLVLCVVTMIISAVGIFSLAAYSVTNRTKEIGIRKVLGASAGNIVMLISTDFIILISVAVLLAWPFSMLLTRQWLADFAYKVEVSWSVYGIAALIPIVVTAMTLAYQLKKAAAVNSVENLRCE